MQVIRQFQDHGLQFQILQIFRRDTRKAQPGSQQISRYCPCRVAVTAMVHRGDQSPVKVVFIFQGAADGDGQGLLRKPIRAEGVYGDDRLGVNALQQPLDLFRRGVSAAVKRHFFYPQFPAPRQKTAISGLSRYPLQRE